MVEQDVSMPEYVWISGNIQGSEYVSQNTECNVKPQVNECLFRDRHIHNPVKDLRWSALEK